MGSRGIPSRLASASRAIGWISGCGHDLEYRAGELGEGVGGVGLV